MSARNLWASGGSFAVVVVIIVVALAVWPHRLSRSDTARAHARQIACNVSQHGLGAHPCAKVVEFTRLAPRTWRVRVEGVPGCFLVHSGRVPPQRTCRV
jgi:hypothetical protein